jgi:3-deoxy-D-manno-octulosonic-acid transferase
VRVCGNLKYDIEVRSAECGVRSSGLGELFAFDSSRPLLVAGSTAPEEEAMLLACLQETRRQPGLEETRLLIAPRHPERFNEVAGLIMKSGLRFARRSEANLAPEEARAADVVLLDSIGELAAIYEFAAVVFVGGSLVPRGGHNIIEPAAFAKPILVGPYTENFRQIISDFVAAGAIVQIAAAEADPGDLSRALSGEVIRLLTDKEAARAMGGRALQILARNRGAVDCTCAAIREVYRPTVREEP